MYPVELKSLGDHIRAKRLDLGLFQKHVAKQVGVTTSTVTNWEKNRTQPQFKEYPKIAEFLGYCPFEQLDTIGEKLRRNRFYLGISQAEMARMLDINPTTLSRLEQNKLCHQSGYRHVQRLNRARYALLRCT